VGKNVSHQELENSELNGGYLLHTGKKIVRDVHIFIPRVGDHQEHVDDGFCSKIRNGRGASMFDPYVRISPWNLSCSVSKKPAPGCDDGVDKPHERTSGLELSIVRNSASSRLRSSNCCPDRRRTSRWRHATFSGASRPIGMRSRSRRLRVVVRSDRFDPPELQVQSVQ